MIVATIVLPDNTYYPTKITHIPNIGDCIHLISFSDLVAKLPHDLEFQVTGIVHNLIDFTEGMQSVKEHTHEVVIKVKPLKA